MPSGEMTLCHRSLSLTGRLTAELCRTCETCFGRAKSLLGDGQQVSRRETVAWARLAEHFIAWLCTYN